MDNNLPFLAVLPLILIIVGIIVALVLLYIKDWKKGLIYTIMLVISMTLGLWFGWATVKIMDWLIK